MKILFFTVTNDLVFDQRMIRICGTLAGAGYRVVLVGRKLPDSPPLKQLNFDQKRLSCFFTKGKLFYVEFNIRLFIWLLFQRIDLICAIDLDTILPCYLVSLVKKIPRVYDAHELFCEMKEVVSRPGIKRIWKFIEKSTVPRFKYGYTVSRPIADIFKQEYSVCYPVIRNLPKYRQPFTGVKKDKIILYQGAVNEGRYFENLIPAMKWVNAPLLIYGDGNFLKEAQNLITTMRLEEKVFLKGKLLPSDLPSMTSTAYIGITLFENTGLSNFYSLSNRFFDYMQDGVPQLCSDYPAYREINEKYDVGILIKDHSAVNIARELNNLLENEVLWNRLHNHCLSAALNLNWENEEAELISFYQKILK